MGECTRDLGHWLQRTEEMPSKSWSLGAVRRLLLAILFYSLLRQTIDSHLSPIHQSDDDMLHHRILATKFGRG